MASDVYFSTNPSDWEKLEGLYISERNPPGFITGADLSIVGFVGQCVRGPVDQVVTITSVGRFLEVFGARVRPGATGGASVGKVWEALLNKKFGTTIRVRRAVAAAAALGTRTYSNAVPTAIIRVDATSVGLWSTDVTTAIVDATNADATMFNLVVTYAGKTYTYENLNTAAGFNNLAEVIGDDLANVVVVTKLADGRPVNAAAAAMASGTDGTIAATDFQTPLADMTAEPETGVVLIPQSYVTASTVNGYLVTQAGNVSDRLFLTWSSDHTNTASDEVTDIAAQITTRSDRIVWCYNSPWTQDPEIGIKIQTPPHVWMASILSQTDVDVNPGAAQCGPLLTGIARLTQNGLQRGDLISLKNAGVATLEKLPGEFRFRSGITTSLTPGKTQITRRRSADFLQLSAASRLRFYVKDKNTPINRGAMLGELTAFSDSLRRAGRIIESFEIIGEAVNNNADRGRGLERVLWRVRLIGHILYLVLETEIGETVEITEQAA
jgi:hypothetical protein